MSTRDELFAVLERAIVGKTSIVGAREATQAVIDAGWRPPVRVIETVEELEALLPRTMILDGDDDPWAKNSDAFFDVWVIPAGSMERTSADLLREMPGPFRVVWEPEGEA